jgi:hypothetical protein
VAAVGDVRVFRSSVVSTTVAPSSLSGGNCTNWTQGFGPTNDNQGTVRRHSVWYGTVANGNGSGHETITITWSGSISGITADLDCLTFSAGSSSTTWSRDGSALTLVNNASSTTITYPTATAGGTGRVYAGFARASSGGSYGNPAGGTSQTDANGNPAIYLLNAGSGSVAPTQTSNATISNTAGLLLLPSAAVTYTATLTVAGVGVVSGPVKLAQAVKAVTGVGVPALAKLDTKAPGLVTGVGAVFLLRTFARPLSVVGVGVVTGPVKSVKATKTVTGVGAVALAKVESKALNVTGVGVSGLAKLDGKLLAVTGVGAVSLQRQFNRTLGVVGQGVVLGPTKLTTKSLKVTGVGVVGLVKLEAKPGLTVAGVGVVSLSQLTIIPPRLAFVLLYDEVVYSVAMSDDLVFSVALTDEPAFVAALRDEPVITVTLADEVVTGSKLMDEHPDVNL